MHACEFAAAPGERGERWLATSTLPSTLRASVAAITSTRLPVARTESTSMRSPAITHRSGLDGPCARTRQRPSVPVSMSPLRPTMPVGKTMQIG
jgi:hypothetical protein